MGGGNVFTQGHAQFAMPKNCEHCGKPFFKPRHITHKVFAERRYCSHACSHGATRRKAPRDG